MLKHIGSLLAGSAILALVTIAAHAADPKNTVAFVPQIVGIPYFDAMEQGGKKGAEAFKTAFIYSGPVDTNPVDQLQIVQKISSTRAWALFRSACSTPPASRRS